ncbi:NnrU family protein [Sphingomonas sp. ac-8]|uniref:NnrU family protein n=1 Tax=Sphingomonas sp. ac-8 TaxID=3242977 RepID=UPI003A7F99D9
MTEFFAALALFLLSHSIPARPATRARLVGAVGLRGYLIGYSILSLGLLAWLIGAATRAPFVPLWDLTLEQYYVPVVLMLPAFLLFVGGAIAANPLSIRFRGARFDPKRPGIVAITRHPILWGFVLWAASHVVPNGDLVSVILFGGFALFALLAMPLIDRRKRRALGPEWSVLAARTSRLPFAALLAGRTRLRWRRGDLLATLALGCGLYAAMLWLHPLLIGPDPTIVFG